ncbi:MAG: hypothetical protein ACXAE3_17045, partial [Candidatus Kariarchaeaceae archaeon]
MSKINVSEVEELIQRIVVRMGDQSHPEIVHVLTKLFPNSPAMRLKSIAEDLADKRLNAISEFTNMIEADFVDREVFDTLSSA